MTPEALRQAATRLHQMDADLDAIRRDFSVNTQPDTAHIYDRLLRWAGVTEALISDLRLIADRSEPAQRRAA